MLELDMGRKKEGLYTTGRSCVNNELSRGRRRGEAARMRMIAVNETTAMTNMRFLDSARLKRRRWYVCERSNLMWKLDEWGIIFNLVPEQVGVLLTTCNCAAFTRINQVRRTNEWTNPLT